MTKYSGAFILLFSILASLAEAAPGALTYQGRIVKADGTPLEYNSVSFSFEITSPDGLCILYREQVDGINMVNSNGVFDVPIGEGVKSFPAGPTFGLLDSFANSGALACDGSANFTPAFDDGRKLRVKFHDGSGWKTVSPDSQIRSVPYAGYARSAAKLGTNVASDFLLKTGIPTCAAGTYLTWSGTALSCSTPAGGVGTVTDVTSANAYLTIATSTTTPQLTIHVGTATNTLAAGDDARFTNARTPTGAASGDLSGTYPNPTVSKIQGVALDFTVAPTSGQVLKYNGTSWAPAADSNSNGTISSLTGEVTASGSGAVAATVVSVGGSAAADIHNAELAANAATNLNTASTIVKRDPSGNFTAGSATLNNTVLKDSGAKSVTLQAPGTVATSYVLKFPDAQGGANEYLMNDGAGNLSWSAVSAGGAGTVTNVTSANNYLTVTNNSSTPLLTLNIGTGANTIAAGNDSRFTDSRAPNGTASGDLSGTYPSPEVAKIQGNAVATGTIPGADIGKVYRWNGTSLTAAFLNFGDMRTALGAQQLVAACAANEKIQWNVITDAFTCQAIGSLNASAITAGTIDTARLPASATYWQDGGSSKIYYSAGNVGIGVAVPNTALDVSGAFSMKGIAAPAVSPAGEGRIYFDSTDKKFKTSVDAGAYADLGAPSFPLTGSFGTAGAPTYSFATDADTGMYRANPDQLAFATGGTQRLRIQDNSFYLGSLGSSTTSSPPSFRFDSIYYGAGGVNSTGRFTVDVTHSLSNTGNVTVPAMGVTHSLSGSNLNSSVSMAGGVSSYFRISNTAGYPGIGYGSIGAITTQTGAGSVTGSQIGSWGIIDLGAGAAMPSLTLASAVKGEIRLAGTATGGSTITTANGLEASISVGPTDTVSTWNGVIVRAPTGTGTVTNKNAIVTESGAGNVGIGTTTPYSPLHVVATSNGAITLQKASNDNNSADFYSYKSRGTPAAPTAALADDRLMGLYALGAYSPTQYSANVGAIQILAKENFTSTAQGTYINFGTTPAGSTTRQTRMTIDADGNVGIGTTSPGTALSVASDVNTFATVNTTNAAAQNVGVYFNQTGKNRWALFKDSAPESGSNVGSDFRINRYNDAGTFIDVPFSIQRNTGYVGMGISVPRAKLDVAGTFQVSQDSTAGILGTINLEGSNSAAAFSGKARWSIYNMNEYGGVTSGLAFYEYRDTDGDGNFCDDAGACVARMIIAPGGNIGIGTLSPTHTLHVVGTAGLSTGTAWTNTSDIRLKDIRGDYEYGLNEILKLHTVRFNYKKNNVLKLPSDVPMTGFIAQEVQKVIPEAVHTRKDGYLELNVDPIHWATVNAVQELHGICQMSQSQLTSLQAKVDGHERRIASLEEENQKLKQQLEKQQKELELIKSKLGM